jgi:hypothetical protein
MEDSILTLFTEFAINVKKTHYHSDIDILTRHTYQNLKNILDFHRQQFTNTTKSIYPIQTILLENEGFIRFTKL